MDTSAATTADKYISKDGSAPVQTTTPPANVMTVSAATTAPTDTTSTATPPTPAAPVSRLAALAAALNDIPRQVEADAEAALIRLQAAREKSSSATARIHDVAGQIETTATAIENFVNQISNGGPPLS
ncbi:hypothetical protein [Bradyrhizobium sp. SZCCHNRI2049]|uniref:hypothetical protein n=1 Tax=Bradyrhizobium sp. SZCCHNRI2049 TaxID=3057287 RepID=UPI002916A4CE|nr:hypothetical protein [Bradyrhizobium sp. SZCCHNRI2049]